MPTNEANDNYKFESLTPIQDSDLGIYQAALDYVFQENDVKNVALSGAYGAGKSSILISYEKYLEAKKDGKKFIHISLAHFEEDDAAKEGSIKESVLEGKILNQLIHQIPESHIPQTNFRVKADVSLKTILKKSCIISLYVLLFLHLSLSEVWERFIAKFPDNWFKNLLLWTTSPYTYFASGLAFACLTAYFIYLIVQLQKNRRILKKLNLKGNEIEIFADSNESYFDKYLNEVLYLFEHADADVIVFEDLDRFDAIQIFERLREVNTLINTRAKDGKIIRFFYLIRDDIFTSKDRTKFFDFIIPVVPVVDGSNSYDQFITHLRKNHLYEKFDQRFLKGLSLYVDEMRLLKNICNEFLIYYENLQATELDCNKMLAIITYKNLFPRDFSDLQLGQGFVHALFARKEEFINSEVQIISNEIATLESRVAAIQSETLNSSSELDTIYNTRINNAYYNNERQRLIQEKGNRKEIIELKNNNKISEIQISIEDKKKKLQELRSYPLRSIINRGNVDQIFHIEDKNEIGEIESYNDVKSNPYFPLLKFLIRNGYIDETYADYMTYFYANSISRTDKIFLRSVSDQKAKEPTYALKEPKKVIEQLDEFDFDQEEILNYSLLDYLIQAKEQPSFLQHLVIQLKETHNHGFAIAYMNVAKMPVEFVHLCNLYWPGLFEEMVSSGKVPDADLKQFAIHTLYCPDENVIAEANTNNCLSEYVSSTPGFLNIEAPRTEKLISGFKLLGVFIKKIDCNTSNTELFGAVYNESLYVISFENICEILRNVYGNNDDYSICHKNYTEINRSPESPLKHYILLHIEEYTEIMLKSCEGDIFDENDASVEYLNNPDVSESHKKTYIEYLKTPIQELTAVESKELWPALMENKCIVFSEVNVMEYFLSKNQIDNILIQFLNEAGNGIDFTKVEGTYSDKELYGFFTAVAACEGLNNSKYEQCIDTLGYELNTFNIQGLSLEKVQILIKYSVLSMNRDTLSFMRSNYPEAISMYIKENVDEYLSIMDARLFDSAELLQVLSMDVEDDKKIQLLSFSNAPISVIGQGYSPKLCAYILQNNCDINDMPELFSNYDRVSSEIQSIILEYAAGNTDILTANIEKCAHGLLSDIFKCNRLSEESKKEVLAALVPIIEKEEAIDYLNEINLPEHVKIFDHHTRPRIEESDYDDELLSAFKDKGWIADYNSDPSKPGYYKIQKARPNK